MNIFTRVSVRTLSQTSRTTSVLSNTILTRERSLTPEFALHLLTPDTDLWWQDPATSLVPFPDPYWAIYWPGGQVMTRFVLDHPAWISGRRVLDLGCGCGATSMACVKSGAMSVCANDIDPWALAATALNFKANSVSDDIVHYCSDDFLAHQSLSTLLRNYQVILVGDMYFDQDLGSQISNLTTDFVAESPEGVALVSDPGRWYLMDPTHRTRAQLNCVAQYHLPGEVRQDHPGLITGSVYQVMEK
ncbi:electron transfer flavoprotein beta subunit lysine methyltransferase-like [Tigriopus californicus]|uniref:electron transfer flavoprotein beta subunit lysine methyltransferase-like n=1 Tax=Tigriopus californicus TaxID=6832 RepID=UPI0027DAA1A9|nr:electron transfer flavoprotein beta subunit lysine methyltransferase-like [Tigriopus californicus]